MKLFPSSRMAVSPNMKTSSSGIRRVGTFFGSRCHLVTGWYRKAFAMEKAILRTIQMLLLQQSQELHHLRRVWAIFFSNTLHGKHVGKFRIGIIMQVSWNPCGEWRFNSGKPFPWPNTITRSTASTLHFCIYSTVLNLLI